MAGIGRAPRVTWTAGLVLLTVSVGLGDTANAAVRICKPSITSGPVSGTSERAARKDALSAWKTKATVYGEPYASWRIAAGKLLKCLPKGSGGFECLASARPCTIEQAPDRRELRQKRLGI